jgi:hypothetical protein
MGGSKAYSYLTPHLALSPDVLFARVWYAKWLKAAWLLLAESGKAAFETGIEESCRSHSTAIAKPFAHFDPVGLCHNRIWRLPMRWSKDDS